MEGQFIYVFSEEDKNKLLESGHHLLLDDARNSIYVFAADNTIYFSLKDVRDYHKSDTLTL